MIYQAECGECRAEFEYVSSVADRNNVPDCKTCGGWAHKVIRSAPQACVKGKFAPYKSMVDGSIISTEKDLREHNSRNGVVLLNDGYSDEAIKAGLSVGKQPTQTKDEVAQDIQEAAKAVYNGYEPTIQTDGALE